MPQKEKILIKPLNPYIIPKSKGVTIFWKPTCPYSRAAFAELKKLADAKGFAIQVWDMNKNRGLYEKLKETTGIMTVPQIFYGNEFIGGHDDLMDLLGR